MALPSAMLPDTILVPGLEEAKSVPVGREELARVDCACSRGMGKFSAMSASAEMFEELRLETSRCSTAASWVAA